jgi:hypothetical protein
MLSAFAIQPQYDMGGGGAGLGAMGAVVGVFYVAILVLIIAAMWKIFTKAGQPGWACIVPIYNILVLLKITGKPAWWIILFLVPIANVIISIIVAIALAEKFGKGAGYGIGLAFLPMVFYPMLGFGSATYRA